MLERAVQDKGELRRRELGRLVGCKYWGPGRFGRALRAGVKQGRLSHPRRGFYGPAGALGASSRRARRSQLSDQQRQREASRWAGQ